MVVRQVCFKQSNCGEALDKELQWSWIPVHFHPLLHPLPHQKGPQETLQAEILGCLDIPKTLELATSVWFTADRPLGPHSLELNPVTQPRSTVLYHDKS